MDFLTDLTILAFIGGMAYVYFVLWPYMKERE